jgi:hypothetical protein
VDARRKVSRLSNIPIEGTPVEELHGSFTARGLESILIGLTHDSAQEQRSRDKTRGFR